jgi:hypothetical protein
MIFHTPKEKSFLRVPLSFGIAAAAAFLMTYFMDGPRLGLHYDLLLNYRPSPPVSREIILIETGPGDVSEPDITEHITEPAALATVLLTLTEFDGAALILDTPILGLSSGEREEELVRRLDGEFSLLGRNIRNLFDAIRVGAVSPEESGHFVEELVGLTEQGKERLEAALTGRDGAGMDRLERAAAVFGGLWRSGQTGIVPSPDLPDRDGVIRRVALVRRSGPDRSGGPVSWGIFRRLFPFPPSPEEASPAEGVPEKPVEHIVYSALKDLRRISEIEYPGDGPVLWNRHAGEGEDVAIPLDKGGAILLEPPRDGESFRRIPLAAFREYDEADRALYRLLKEGEGLGIYNSLAPEDRPPLVYEYILSLREDLLQDPDPDKKAAWIAAREDYLRGLEDFLAGPAEAALVTGYEELIAGEDPEGGDGSRLRALRGGLIKTFGDIRQAYTGLKERRDALAPALTGSFCIFGPAGIPGPAGILGPAGPVPGTSALLANALLTGRAVRPGADRYILFWSLVCAFLVCLCIGGMGTVLSFCAGLLLTLLGGAVFSYSFVRTAYWIDPLIPMTASAAGVLSSACCAFIIRGRFKRWLREAYEPFIPRAYLRRIIRTGKPLPAQCLSVRAAVVAVKNTGLTLSEDQDKAPASARNALAFREEVGRLFIRAGAVIAGGDGDLVLAAFGSPPERAAAGDKGNSADPGTRAALFVAELARNIPPEDPAPGGSGLSEGGSAGRSAGQSAGRYAAWHFGIDVGECAFIWSPQSGYRVFGRPVVRSRILSGLNSRYRTRILISAGVNEKLTQQVVRKLGTLKAREEGERETFYELLTEKTPGDIRGFSL